MPTVPPMARRSFARSCVILTVSKRTVLCDIVGVVASDRSLVFHLIDHSKLSIFICCCMSLQQIVAIWDKFSLISIVDKETFWEIRVQTIVMMIYDDMWTAIWPPGAMCDLLSCGTILPARGAHRTSRRGRKIRLRKHRSEEKTSSIVETKRFTRMTPSHTSHTSRRRGRRARAAPEAARQPLGDTGHDGKFLERCF